ncbi:MAG: hypothetical protein KAG20_01905 [Cocleimonas sp.]|nr:hypothetical protein [Cocleimonas sp.]
MKNTVIAQVNYSFKGENFTPSILLEIDLFAAQYADFSSLCRTIAQQNKIDTYSYAYDIMDSSALVFHSPKGNIVDFVIEGCCDLKAYQQFLKQNEMHQIVEKVAANILGIEDIYLKENEKIKQALDKVYQAGMKAC